MKFTFNKKVLTIFSFIVILTFSSRLVFAVWNGTFYDPGDTLNPECLPTQTDCDVRSPLTSLNISDTVYGAGWDTDATHAPSKNAVYDQIQVLVASNHNPVTIGATPNGLSLATQVLSLALASTSTTGALSDTDWDTFNNKANTALSNLASVAINAPLATGAGTTLALSSTAPTATTGASQAGIPLTLTASNAVASTDTAGAAAGGNITITAGNAARLTSGNANGGNVHFVFGTAIGTGTAGSLVLAPSTTDFSTAITGTNGFTIYSRRSDANGGTLSFDGSLSVRDGYFGGTTPGSAAPVVFNSSGVRIGSAVNLGFTPTTNASDTPDIYLGRIGAANPGWGLASATPVAYTHTMASNGTGTNIAGANATIQPGMGTGSATPSNLYFSTPDATTSGTTQQTATPKMTIGTGVIANKNFEAWGTGTYASSNVRIGDSAVANGNSATYGSIAIGKNASANSASVIASIAIGSQSISTGGSSIALGSVANASASGAISIGTNSISSGSVSVSMGNSAQATGANATAIGGSLATADRAIAIGGYGAVSAYANSVAIGTFATTTAARQMVLGGNDATTNFGIQEIYLGSGVTQAAPGGVTVLATGGSGTDIAGASLTLAGGKGTGNALGGSLIFSTSDAGATGTTLQSLTPKMTILPSGYVGIGTTSPSSKLQVGTQTSSSTATPDTMSLGGTYGDSVATGYKLKLYDDGTTGNDYAWGISSGQMNFKTTNGGSLNYYGTTNLVFKVNSFTSGGGIVSYGTGNSSFAGNVGIGTTAPAGLLHVSSDTVDLGKGYFTQANASADSFDFNFRKARGTGAAPTVITTADELGVLNFTGYGGAAGYITGAAIKAISSGTIADSRVPGQLSFWTGTNAAPSVLTERMTILNSGNVGIGTTAPGYLLTVNGIASAGTINSSGGYELSGGVEFVAALNTPYTGITIHGRNSSTSADADIYLVGGTTGATFGVGGKVRLQGGVPTDANTNGGDVTLDGGAPTGTGVAGNIILGGTRGLVGIGTTAPAGLLHVSSDTVDLGKGYFTQANASADSFDFNFRKARGTGATPTVITTADELGVINFTGYGGAAGYITGAAIKAISSGTIADSRVPGQLSFWTGTNAAPSVLTERMTILNSGNVGIGTTGPTAPLEIRSTSAQLKLTEPTNGDRSSTIETLSNGSLRLTPYTAGTGANIELMFSGSSYFSFLRAATGKVYIYGASSGTLVMDANGSAMELNGTTIALNTDALFVAATTKNVGIGTIAPASHLQIDGNKSATAWTTDGIAFDVNAATYTDTSTAAAGTVAIRTANSFGAPTFASTNAITVTDAFTLYVPKPIAGTNTTITRANSAYFEGNVGIGTTTPTYALDVLASGTGVIARFNSTNATGCTLADGGTITCTSDERMKKNIEDISYGLNTVMGLRPVLYNWKYENDGKEKNLGFIAQEVENLVPKLVVTDENGMKSLNTTAMVPILTKAIQEMNLTLEGISGTITPLAGSASESFVTAFFNNIKTTIGTWLADATNGITKIFTGEIETKSLCVSDENGEKTCITKAQLDALISNAGVITPPQPLPEGEGAGTIEPPPSGEAGGGEPTPAPAPELPTPEGAGIPTSENVGTTPEPSPQAEPTPEPELPTPEGAGIPTSENIGTTP